MAKIICNRTGNALELKLAFAVRKRVFIEEQHISEEEEWDGLDDSAVQFVFTYTVFVWVRANHLTRFVGMLNFKPSDLSRGEAILCYN